MSATRAVRLATPPAAVPEMAGGFNPHLGDRHEQRAEGTIEKERELVSR